MANNRIFIMHRPTGLAVCLGKRMGGEWYVGAGHDDMQAQLGRFYEKVYMEMEGVEQIDDFCIALESVGPLGGEGLAPLATTDWDYGPRDEDGVLRLRLPEVVESDES